MEKHEETWGKVVPFMDGNKQGVVLFSAILQPPSPPFKGDFSTSYTTQKPAYTKENSYTLN